MNITPYNNVILDFGVEPKDIAALTKRLENKGQTVEVIQIVPELMDSPTEFEKSVFERIDINTRIYIYAHGGVSRSDTIVGIEHSETEGRKNIDFNYKQVSDYLGDRLKKEIKGENHKHLKISIIACYAGLIEANAKDRFAVQLHRDLATRNSIVTDIVARKHIGTMITEGEHAGKLTVRTTEERNIDELSDTIKDYFQQWLESSTKKPGTKIKFTWSEQGEQIAKDAYVDKFYKFADKACLDLSKSISKTHPPNAEKLLAELAQITELIKKEPNSIDDIKSLYFKLSNLANEVGFESNNLKKSFDIVNKYIHYTTKEETLVLFQEKAENTCSFNILDKLSDKKLNQEEKNEIKAKVKELIINLKTVSDAQSVNKILITIRNISRHEAFKNDKELKNDFRELVLLSKLYVANNEFLTTKHTGHKYSKTV